LELAKRKENQKKKIRRWQIRKVSISGSPHGEPDFK